MLKNPLAIFLLIFVSCTAALGQNSYRAERQQMVNVQIKQRGVEDLSTLVAMNTVPRHQFVPQDQQAYAYEDRPLPIGYGQTISQPYIVGYMTDALSLDAQDKVLEVGTGSGYQAAVLSEIVDSVFTIEIVAELATASASRLNDLGYANVFVKHADGYHGWEEHGPFDAIMVTAASEFIPPPLIEQLKDGGKMIIPVGSPYSVQHLVLVTKSGSEVRTKNLLPVRFVPFTRN